jgi:hypothetical protein
MSLIITSEPNRRGRGEQASHNSIEMIGQTFLIPLRRCSYCESIAVLLVGAGDASAGGIARGTAHGSGGSDNAVTAERRGGEVGGGHVRLSNRRDATQTKRRQFWQEGRF